MFCVVGDKYDGVSIVNVVLKWVLDLFVVLVIIVGV